MSKANLKIGLVFDDSLDSNDGVQQYVKTLGEWLIKQGHTVKFLVGETKDAGQFQEHVFSLSKNMSVRGNQNKMFLPIGSDGKEIDSVLASEEFDVLHVMLPSNPMMGSRVIHRSGGTPVVGTFHMVGGTSLINFGAKILSRLQRNTLNRLDKALSVSVAAQDFASEYFNLESEVCPNMVDVSRFQSGEVRKDLQGKDGTIVFLGRLVERKGAIHLLKAAAILKRDGDLGDVRIHICGDGELRGSLEIFCKDNELENNVVFHGFIDEEDKGDYLASANLAVFPAIGGEAFGIVLIEAMAAKNPVVLAGNNAGYASVMGEESDQLFDPFEHGRLAAKISHYLADKSARQNAQSWQKKAIKEFDVDEVGARVVKHYRRAIDDNVR